MYDLNLRKERLEIISLFYRYFLLNYNQAQMQQDILSETQFTWKNPKVEEYVTNLAQEVDHLKAKVEEHLKQDWSWDRLPNLVKASLVEGVFEIENTMIPKAVTIDSITQIVKELQPDWDYKFVNALLDKFNKA